MTFLYHGTNGAWIDNILRTGLHPRGASQARNNWKHVPHQSNSKCVYLSDSYAPYFAFNAARGKRPVCGVVEVDLKKLDLNQLFADEDALEQLTRGRDGVAGTMSERTLFYRKQQFNFIGTAPSGHRAWQMSLGALGTCVHRGPIPPAAITRAVTWPHAGRNLNLCFVWDPTITVINQKICGDRYRALTAKLFGDEPDMSKLHEADRAVVVSFDPAKIAGYRLIDLCSQSKSRSVA